MPEQTIDAKELLAQASQNVDTAARRVHEAMEADVAAVSNGDESSQLPADVDRGVLLNTMTVLGSIRGSLHKMAGGESGDDTEGAAR